MGELERCTGAVNVTLVWECLVCKRLDGGTTQWLNDFTAPTRL